MKDKKNKKFLALFQMDPLENLNFDSDTTINLIKEAIDRNIDVWIGHPKNLSFSNENASIVAKKVFNSNLNFGKSKILKLNEIDFYFIRQDPPFDMSYLTNCYLLELHKSFNKKPFFVNDPSGIKNFTEKIFPLYFYKLMPKSCVTEDEEIFLKMLHKYKRLVVKTLYNKGGEGVVKVSEENKKKAINEFAEIKKKYSVPVVVQEFLDGVIYGDKRVILIDGKPEGVINRIPKKGEFKANLHLGGQAKQTTLTKKEKKICMEIKKTLKKEKLFFVGIDLINEKLTEINVTSPTGIVQILNLSGIDLAKKLWQKLLKKMT
jgi:glutathione synthase